MSVLIITDEVRQLVRELRDFAERPEHYYDPGPRETWGAKPCPGDNPRHVVYLASYRCVYSITLNEGTHWRHLSISVAKHYPNPIAAFTIGDLFGFTGWDGTDVPPKGWSFLAKPEPERCIVMCQKIESP